MAQTKKIFFPTTVGDVSAHVSNVDEKLTVGGLGAKYGINAVDMARSASYKTDIPAKVAAAEAAMATAQGLNTEKDEMIYNARIFYNDMGHQMQKNAAFDAADMEALGFFKLTTPPDPATAKAKISHTTVLPDQAILDWVKGPWDGVYIESLVQGGNNNPGSGSPSPSPMPDPGSPLWQKLGEDEKSPFEDTRKNQGNTPEVRYYRMRYKKDNKPVGLYSDIVKVIVEIY